ncbi:9251_t:CDS:2, partial [Funneliformis mosseae]
KITLFARTAIDLDLNKEVIILPPLPGTESETHIYKHRCYDYFKKIILESKKHKRFCITGNPGTGKTFFGRYIMSVLLKEGSELLVDDASYPHLYLITRDEMNDFDVEWVQNVDYGRVAGRDNVWCIIDGKPPRVNHDFDTGKLIMVSSPKDLNIKNFCKPVNITIKVYMQIWSEDELEECRSLIYPEFSKDNLHESYQLCGGIPRMIFKYTLDEIDDMITASVDNIDTRLFRYISTVSEGDVYSHNLVHIHTNEKQINVIINERTFFKLPYTSCELKFASTIVGNKVFARLKEFYKEETYKFVFASASVSLLGSVRGYMFEIIAHNELSAGKTFLTRSLEKHKKSSRGKELELKLPRLTTKNCYTVDDIEDGKYCKPVAKNFETIDAIYIGKDYDFTFQMTVGRTHDIKQHGYELLHERLGGESADHTIRHYFVVPKDTFKNFQKQPFTVKKEERGQPKNVVNVKQWITKRIEQYVLLLDVAMEICELGGNIKKFTVQGFYERNIKNKDILNNIGLWFDSKLNIDNNVE